MFQPLSLNEFVAMNGNLRSNSLKRFARDRISVVMTSFNPLATTQRANE
jgi:hypothetical protein